MGKIVIECFDKKIKLKKSGRININISYNVGLIDLNVSSSKLTTGIYSIVDTVVGFIKKIFKKGKDDEYYE